MERSRPYRTALAALLCATWLCGCATASRPRGSMDRLSAAQLLAVADALEQSGDTVRAEQYLQQALKLGAPARAVVPRLLRMYVADGQYRLAIDQAENHLRKHPRDHGVRLFLATLYGALGQELHALRQYERVLAEEPKDAQAHFAMASVLHEAGHEHARADEHFRAYLALEPYGAHAEEARALLLSDVTDARSSARELEVGASVDAPDTPEAESPARGLEPSGAPRDDTAETPAPGPVRVERP
jgi:tetratricopeptide (TPR) repeat protein